MGQLEIAFSSRSFGNSPYSGDQCGYWEINGTYLLTVVDGLGHGLLAEEAAKAAIEVVSSFAREVVQMPEALGLENLLQLCDTKLRHTRGVVMNLLLVQPSAGYALHAGVGNVRTVLLGEKIVRAVNQPGIVGAGFRKIKLERFSFTPDDALLMFTDGIPEHCDLSRLPRPLSGRLQEWTDTLIADYARDNDDALALLCHRGLE